MTDPLDSLLRSLGRERTPDDAVEILGADPVLPTAFRVGEAAATALAAVGVMASDLWWLRTGRRQDVRLEVPAAAASLLSFARLSAPGLDLRREAIPRPTVRLYPCRDGAWIHLHGGFPHLCDGLLQLLGCPNDSDAIAKAVAEWDAQELEDAIAGAALCGARVRSQAEWRAHPQGQSLASAPVVEITRIGDSPAVPVGDGKRPLGGARVLDLTRVLAGPTCARTLAEQGANVLHIRSPELPFILPFVMDTNHGKRSALLDLNRAEDGDRLRELVLSADVFSQGYRHGALERRGFGPEELAELRPGIVYVSVNCYGHAGPWRERGGWEQLAQSVTGIAAEPAGEGPPTLLPAAATDYTTGYLAAAGALAALARRASHGGSYHVRVSLSRTGMWLQDLDRVPVGSVPAAADVDRYTIESTTAWGPLRHLAPALQMSETAPRWERAVAPLGSHPAQW